jgi:hypothetical protein
VNCNQQLYIVYLLWISQLSIKASENYDEYSDNGEQLSVKRLWNTLLFGLFYKICIKDTRKTMSTGVIEIVQTWGSYLSFYRLAGHKITYKEKSINNPWKCITKLLLLNYAIK